MKKKKQQETEKFVSTEIKQNKMANEDYQKIKAFFVVLIIVIALVGLLFLFNGKVVTKEVDEIYEAMKQFITQGYEIKEKFAPEEYNREMIEKLENVIEYKNEV